MPLHPLVVHFPIALLFVAAIIEVVNVFVKKETLNKFGTLLMIIGIVTGVGSYLSGENAEHFAKNAWGKSVHETIELHEFYAGLSLLVFFILLLLKLIFKHSILKEIKWSKGAIIKGVSSILIVLLCIFGITALIITGHLGGKVVYNQPSQSIEVNFQNE
ncbi:DUF2231 domain-containing protein [Lysinibacillus endophyticus]|uniref:DUF2231 domain-containing protein n=1 Tax=Ureibacillus endophyticus TaxID=1978490 RepID=A0A494Z784_9BACL|nr:DUF2231 domain-containing protein [Lysinibacillus endophyticus]MCP1145034.1 hypothetical protein [Lysinibacillus endophyticus]RKQ18460.1 hypothetical protein D8M03_05285 [Lysinibacillus endophyticus]